MAPVQTAADQCHGAKCWIANVLGEEQRTGAHGALFLHSMDRMDQLIPTLLGIAGALVPVALAWWQQERPTRITEHGRPQRPAGSLTGRFVMDDAVVRGGRVYL